MLVTFWALNNITVYRIFHARCGILFDSFLNQTTDDYDKRIEQKGNKNTAKIASPILLVIKMYIKST